MYIAEAFAPHTDRASSRVLSSQVTISGLRFFDMKSGIIFFQRWIIVAKERVKPKEETNGKGRARERERGARCAIATRTFFLSSRELYNLRYVTSPSKIHFTIHTNIYNRYINNMADNYSETAPDIQFDWIFPIE